MVHNEGNNHIFAQAYDSAPFGIGVYAPDKNRWIRANPFFCKILGYTLEELQGSIDSSFTHPEDKALNSDPVIIGAASDQTLFPYKMERRYLHKDGHIVRVSLNISPLTGQRTDASPLLLVHITDITDQHRYVERLLDSERKHRMIAEVSLDWISRQKADDEATVVYSSPICKSILGYEPEEMIAMSGVYFVHPDDLERVKNFLSAAQRSERDKVIFRFRRKDGSYIWLESSSRFTFDENGNMEEIISISRDITDRRKADQLLEESEQRYKSLFDNNPAAVYSMNLDGDYLTANANLEKLTGYTLEELIGMYWGPIVDPKDLPKTLHHFGLAKQGYPQSYPVNRLIFTSILKKMSYEADVVVNGAEAVRAVKHGQYDFVFMDLQMPVMDGFEAAAAILGHFEEGDSDGPAIIAVTAFAQNTDRDMCLAAGMKDFISKPVFAPEVDRVLRHWSPGLLLNGS